MLQIGVDKIILSCYRYENKIMENFMSRYISDRPCPIHGPVVERYLKDNRCCECHAQHQRDSRLKRSTGSCPKCKTVMVNGYCKPCRERYLTEQQHLPCPICGQVNRDSAGRCLECGKKLFDRPVPRHSRREMIAFLQAINLTYGVKLGDKTWGGITFDGSHYKQIIEFIMGSKK